MGFFPRSEFFCELIMIELRKGILTSLANNAHVDNMVHSDCEPAGRKLCCEMTADDEGNIDRQTWSK